MSSKAITERRDLKTAGKRWQAPRELAPSVVKADEPWIARLVGAFGLALIVLGGVVFLLRAYNWPVAITPTWASFFIIVGVGGLLAHAASDADFQIRRAYMILGYVWLGVGVVLSAWPMQTDSGLVLRGLFLPYGLGCSIIGVLFLMAIARHETEKKLRDIASYVNGGLGAAMSLGGLFVGTINKDLLLPNCFLLALFGLLYVWAFIGVRGSADDLGYYAGLSLGLAGALAFAIALVRSLLLPWFAKQGWMQPQGAYAMPFGLALMLLGMLYVAVCAGVCSDNRFVVLTRRELASLFSSPIAYITIVGLMLIAWFLFSQFVGEVLTRLDPLRGEDAKTTVKEPIIQAYILTFFPIICLIFMIPTVTMRLFSEEHRTGTLEMMLTAPVNETPIVLSKFAAAWVFYMIAWVPWGLFLVALWALGGQPFDYYPVIAWYIVLGVTGAGFLSMGVFFSSLTKNQITAAILTFVGMVGLTMLFWARRWIPMSEGMKSVLTHATYVDLWINVVEGRLGARELLFHISATVLWLFLTVQVLASRKWR
jgi:hypothetical protein